MFDMFAEQRKRIDQPFDETKWRYIWVLYGAGVLLLLALIVMNMRLELLLRRCHCLT